MKGIFKLIASLFMAGSILAGNTLNAQMPIRKNTNKTSDVHLIILDPGHFHAALVQKYGLPGVSDTVMVYAPAGKELNDYLELIRKYNTRTNSPTAWKEIVYSEKDYLAKMLAEKRGNVVIIAGNNKLKAEYIHQSLKAGLNVLADKPMAINHSDFLLLGKDIQQKTKNSPLLYDIMTERYSVMSILQKRLMKYQNVFGQLQKGSASDPAVSIESVHHFYKEVSGAALIRPAWFFDIHQQGEGITDICTHLVDIVQWLCYPEKMLDYKKDITITSSAKWATSMDAAQFQKVTGLKEYPQYLADAVHDNVIKVYSNGSIAYKLKDTYVNVKEQWNYEAPEGAGDLFYSVMKGTNSTLVVEQGGDQQYIPELYIIPAVKSDSVTWKIQLQKVIEDIAKDFPGIALDHQNGRLHLSIPIAFRTDHETQFSLVANQYFKYLAEGKMPEWEKYYMLAKYFTTTQAASTAVDNPPKQ
ncbi:MAG: putative oxidoreductase C-terminal domain-containing protein [Flavitalea sp.]